MQEGESMNYKNIIVKTQKLMQDTFHDDEYSDKNVEIVDFPYKRLFGDFRIFNGLPYQLVDEYVGKIREIMIAIANEHASREERKNE